MFPKKDPRRVRISAPVWSHEQFKAGGAADGWLGGETVWVFVHYRFVATPCFKELTDGKLACPLCGKCEKNFEQGYMPWLAESGKPMMTVVMEPIRPLLAKIEPFEPIAIRKGKSKFSPVVVRPRTNAAKWKWEGGEERTEEQFERWLLRLWGKPELAAFFLGDKALSPPAQEAAAPDPARPGRAPVYTPDQERELIRGCLPVRPADGDGGGMRLLGEALPPPPSPNGKHRKKTE